MTGTLRSTARNPVAIALMGLLILVFLALGVGGGGRFPDAFRGTKADSVISVGSHSVSATDYRRIFDQQKQRFEEQSHQSLTADFLIKNGFDLQLLNQLAQDQAEAELLARIGIDPAPGLVDEQIKHIPAAFDRVTGKFSPQQFAQFLAANGLTAAQVQTLLSDELADRHFTAAVAANFQAPRVFAALNAVQGLQNRDVSYFTLDARAVVPPPPASDAQLTTFLKAHAAQLTRPEMRTITLARFSASALAAGIVVSPADIQKEFDFRKDTLSTPETRTIIQIPVKTADQGAQAARRLAAGEDPAAIARSFGAEPVIYADKPRSAIADGKLAAAAFAATAGQVSGPVQGDLGLAAIKVAKITPGKTATLDSARAQIEADLRLKAAQAKAYQLSQAFDDARQGGAGVADAARKAGVPTISVGPVTAQGADVDGKPNPLITDKIAKTAFAMRAGEDSDIQDAGAGDYYALKVDRVLPPALPSLDEVRAPLTQAYAREQLSQALRAKADALMALVRQGKSLDEVAAGVGAHVTREAGMQLIQMQKYQALGQPFVAAIFGHKPGDVFDAGGKDGVFIARLDAVRPGDVTETARLVESLRSRASQEYLQSLVAAAKTAAAQQIKPVINLKLARTTMGVDPATLDTPASKARSLAGGAAK
jgi:peptidyl-prolyl cis-trans isomerase D